VPASYDVSFIIVALNKSRYSTAYGLLHNGLGSVPIITATSYSILRTKSVYMYVTS